MNQWFEFVAGANEAAGAESWLSLSEFTDRLINSGVTLEGAVVTNDEATRQRAASAIGQIMAQLIAIGVYQTREGVRYTQNLKIAVPTAEARPTQLGLRLLRLNARWRKFAMLGLTAAQYVKSTLRRWRWVVVAGSSGLAVVKAVQFYKIALTEISSEAGWLLAVVIGAITAFVAAVMHRLR